MKRTIREWFEVIWLNKKKRYNLLGRGTICGSFCGSFFSYKYGNKLVSIALLLVMIISYLVIIFIESRNSVSKCCKYLGGTTTFGSFIVVYVLCSIFNEKIYNIESLGDISIMLYFIVYTLILLIFFILVALKAELKVAKLSFLIIATIMTVIFSICSMLMNLIPLSQINKIVCSGMSEFDLIYFRQNYDGRVLFTFLLQLVTYPIWIDSLIGTIIAEKRDNNLNTRMDD